MVKHYYRGEKSNNNQKVTYLVSPDIIAVEEFSFVMFIMISPLHIYIFTPLDMSAFLHIATPSCTLRSSSSIHSIHTVPRVHVTMRSPTHPLMSPTHSLFVVCYICLFFLSDILYFFSRVLWKAPKQIKFIVIVAFLNLIFDALISFVMSNKKGTSLRLSRCTLRGMPNLKKIFWRQWTATTVIVLFWMNTFIYTYSQW